MAITKAREPSKSSKNTHTTNKSKRKKQDLLTATEAAKCKNYSLSTIYRWLRQGKINGLLLF